MTLARLLPAVVLVVLSACGSRDSEAPAPSLGEAPRVAPAAEVDAPALPPAPPAPVPAPVELPLTEAPAPPAESGDAASADTGAEPAGHGRVVVRVLYAGDPPAPRKLTADPATAVGCDELHGPMDLVDDSVVVSAERRVANTVITLERAGLAADGTGQMLTVDQRGCRFQPHVSVVPMGAELRFLNSDGINHNVHVYARKNNMTNSNIAPGGELRFQVPRDDQIRVTCDIHPWMSSWVFVSETPFAAVTDTRGEAVFVEVPAGEYKVGVWHEKLELAGSGRKRAASPRVEVTAEGTAELEVEVEP